MGGKRKIARNLLNLGVLASEKLWLGGGLGKAGLCARPSPDRPDGVTCCPSLGSLCAVSAIQQFRTSLCVFAVQPPACVSWHAAGRRGAGSAGKSNAGTREAGSQSLHGPRRPRDVAIYTSSLTLPNGHDHNFNL